MLETEFTAEIDPIQYAKESRHLCVHLPLQQFKRLQEIVGCEPQPNLIACDLRFTLNEQGVATIKGKFSVEVELQCQRCGHTFTTVLQANCELYPMVTEQQMALLDNAMDVLVTAGEKINIIDIIEDELIVALPMFAKHAEAECQVKLDNTIISGDSNKPFADLANLM